MEQKCVYCEDVNNENEAQEVLYECDECGTLYCDDCGAHGCPNCGASLSHAHPIEKSGGSSWNPNQGF